MPRSQGRAARRRCQRPHRSSLSSLDRSLDQVDVGGAGRPRRHQCRCYRLAAVRRRRLGPRCATRRLGAGAQRLVGGARGGAGPRRRSPPEGSTHRRGPGRRRRAERPGCGHPPTDGHDARRHRRTSARIGPPDDSAPAVAASVVAGPPGASAPPAVRAGNAATRAPARMAPDRNTSRRNRAAGPRCRARPAAGAVSRSGRSAERGTGGWGRATAPASSWSGRGTSAGPRLAGRRGPRPGATSSPRPSRGGPG